MAMLPTRVATEDRGKAWRRRLTANRAIPAFLLVAMFLLVAWGLAKQGELMATGRAQFFRDQGWAVPDYRFAPSNLSIPRIEVLSSDTDLRKTAEHEEGCVARAVDSHRVSYPSDHRFYAMLRDITPLPPPVFRGMHSSLCTATDRDTRRFNYCLPITGRKDEPYCSAPDRLDLLARQSKDSMCYGSVLHMLMADVYNELKAIGAQPLVVYGTLLGAIRDSSVISFTEDADVSYMKMNKLYMKKLQRKLWDKGYHMFLDGIWRVCVAPTHPLAANLYDPKAPGGSFTTTPYVDMYAMERENSSAWWLEEAKDDRRLPEESVRPFAKVRINGLEFDTVHDPVGFLTDEYGPDFMTPKPRE